jgi:hypothetical protein
MLFLKSGHLLTKRADFRFQLAKTILARLGLGWRRKGGSQHEDSRRESPVNH